MAENKTFNIKDEPIPDSVQKNWQRIVNIMAEILNTTAALITKVDKPYIKIITTNAPHNNPLSQGEVFKLAGHYCEQVVKNRDMLEVTNCKTDDNWENNPELEYDLISYLGFPIMKSDGEIFGTLCVLDDKERYYQDIQKKLLLEFKLVIESQLNNIILNNKLNLKLDQIKALKEKYKTLFDNINDALFLHRFEDKIGKFVEVNKMACKRLGYTREELLEMSPDDIDPPRFNNSQKKENILKQLDKKGEITFEVKHVTKNGNKLPVEINSKIITYKQF